MGGFEAVERHFVACFLRPGDTFVDVGANIGLYAVSAARWVGNRGAVYAFEPNFKSYQRLQGNIRRNGLTNVRCFRLALTDAVGVELLRVPATGYDAWSSLSVPDCEAPSSTEEVRTTTWDAFVAGHGPVGNVSLMKIDIEGAEARFVRGAMDFLSDRSAPTLLIEFNDRALRSTGASRSQLARALRELGYDVFQYEAGDRSLRRADVRSLPDTCNVIACKDDRFVLERLREGPDPGWLR